MNGFSDEERSGWKPIIYKNVVYSMRILVKQTREFAAVDPNYALQPNNVVNFVFLYLFASRRALRFALCSLC
jgi:hypothetical protein